MASQEEIRIRTEFCAQQLAGGVDVSSAVFLAQCHFDVSQRTAYRYVKAAEELIEQEDDAPAECESAAEARMQSMVKLAEMRLIRALSMGDEKELAAATKAHESLRKMCGYALQLEGGVEGMRFSE